MIYRTTIYHDMRACMHTCIPVCDNVIFVTEMGSTNTEKFRGAAAISTMKLEYDHGWCDPCHPCVMHCGFCICSKGNEKIGTNSFEM